MSRRIRNILITLAVIGGFSIVEPSYCNLITKKAYAEDVPYLKNIAISGMEKINVSQDVNSYIIDVNKDEDVVFLKARPNDTLDGVKINGKEATKESYFKQKVMLVEGKNTVEIEVEDDKSTSVSLYKVYIYRGGKSAVYFDDIKINNGEIGFTKGNNFYNIELDEGTKIVELQTFPGDGNHSIFVNGRELGETNSIKLKFNGIGKYTLNVELRDKDTKRIGYYTFDIYLGIPVSPNVSDSINKVIKPNQWLIVNGRWRYNDSVGKYIKNNWFYDSKYKSYFYFNERGNMHTGWLEYNDKYYYLNSQGEMQTGWLYSENKWYFLDSNGAMKIGWAKDNDKWYYFKEDGSMVTGWTYINNKWYYLRQDGSMKTGWIYYDKKWYFLNSEGAMETGWIKISNEWYYLNSDGSMKSGEWIYTKGNWYYLNYSGNMRCGWLFKDDKYYHFNEDGKMCTTTQTIDGYTYEFNRDGSVNFN